MVDYSAFDEKNVKQYNGKLPGLPKISSPLTGLIIVFVFIILLLSPTILGAKNSLVTLLLSAGVAYVAYRLTWNGRDASIRTALFAKRNGFGYSWKGGKLKTLEGMGSVLGEPMMSNVVTGSIFGQKFKVCGVYNGKVAKNIMMVTLPNNYPHIILDSKENNQIVSNLHRVFPSSKEITLEGDFPNYFRVFSASTPVETLQILSPELMGRMIDYAHRADIEILDNQLLLICNFKYVDKKIYEIFFTAVEQILKDIGIDANNSKVTFDSDSRVF